MSIPDLEVIKEIPGYKVILKAVLKTQIQLLVEQLAAHTDEESVILTASVADGTLSHLGSDSGKSFLDGHEDMKSQFLGFCLSRQNSKTQKDKEQPPHNMTPGQAHHSPASGSRFNFIGHSLPYAHQSKPKNTLLGIRLEPYSVSSRPHRRKSADIINTESSEGLSSITMKMELDNTLGSDNTTGLPNNLSCNNQSLSQVHDRNEEDQTDSTSSVFPVEQTNIGDDVAVKVEALLESELELEITSVEQVSKHLPNNNWTHLNFDPSGAAGNQTDIMQAAQQGYSPSDSTNQNDHGSKFDLPSTHVTFSQLSVPLFGQSPLDMTLQSGYKPYIRRQLSDEEISQGEQLQKCNELAGAYGKAMCNDIQNWVSSGQSQYSPTQRGSSQKLDVDDKNKCAICGKGFNSKWKLDTHVRIHTGERPFECEVCLKKFSVKCNLKSHMITHFRPSQFQ